MTGTAAQAHHYLYSGFQIRIQGKEFSPGTVLDFDGRGRLLGARLGGDHAVDGITFRKGTEIVFDRNGHARVACLASTHQVRGEIYPAGTMITRQRNGQWAPLLSA